MEHSSFWGGLCAVALLASACGGAPSSEPEGRTDQAISSGVLIEATNFPATAALRHGDVTVGVTCSGTLVAPTWVLTAAHCVKNVGSENPQMWTVYFGSDDLNANAARASKYSVVEIHAHPDWNPQTIRLGFGDLALMKLDRAVTGVTPAPLRRSKVAAGTTLALVGYGKATAQPTSEDQLSGILRGGENTSIACSTVPFDDASRPEILDARSICFDSERAPGSCERDSGGPAYMRGESGGIELAGVVSGSRDTNIGACGKYAIYAAVSQELSFIDGIAGTGAGSNGTSGGQNGVGGLGQGNGTEAKPASRGCSVASPNRGSDGFAASVGILLAIGYARRRWVSKRRGR